MNHRVRLVLVEMAWIVSVGAVSRILRWLIVLLLNLVGLMLVFSMSVRVAEFFWRIIDISCVAVHAIIVFFSRYCRWLLNLNKWCLLVRVLQRFTVPLVLEWPRVGLPGCDHRHIGCRFSGRSHWKVAWFAYNADIVELIVLFFVRLVPASFLAIDFIILELRTGLVLLVFYFFFIEQEVELVRFGQGDPRDFVVYVLLGAHLLRGFPVQEVKWPLLFQLC